MAALPLFKKGGENTLYCYFLNNDQLVLELFVKRNTIMHNVERIVEDVPDYDTLTGYEQIRAWLQGFKISSAVQTNSATAEESAAASEELSGQNL